MPAQVGAWVLVQCPGGQGPLRGRGQRSGIERAVVAVEGDGEGGKYKEAEFFLQYAPSCILAILLQADWTLVFILAAAEFNKVLSYTHFIVHTHCMKCRQHNIGGGSCFPACQLDIVKMQCASCNLWQESIMEKCKILVKMHIQSHNLQPSTSPCNLQSYSPIFCRQIFSGLICWNPVALGHLVHFWRPAAILRTRCSHRTGQCWNGYKSANMIIFPSLYFVICLDGSSM